MPHVYSLCVLKSGAYHCLDEEDLSDILNTELPAPWLYQKGIFQAACRVLLYKLANAAQNHFQVNVFKPVIKNPEIQAHLGLGLGQAVFDQYCFAYILIVCIICILSHQYLLLQSGYQILQIPNFDPVQTRKLRSQSTMWSPKVSWVEVQLIFALYYCPLRQSLWCSACTFEWKAGS